MEVMEAIEERRAVREYTEDPIDRELIQRIITAATLAPSAHNAQPWAFAVFEDAAQIESYSERAKKWLIENIPYTYRDPAMRLLFDDPQFTLFYHAPVLVLVLAKAKEQQSIRDCGLAAENLMLAARGEGLGTCWIGFATPWLNLTATKRELGVPENYEVIAPIVLGYPKAWPRSHGRRPAEIYWLGRTEANRYVAVPEHTDECGVSAVLGA